MYVRPILLASKRGRIHGCRRALSEQGSVAPATMLRVIWMGVNTTSNPGTRCAKAQSVSTCINQVRSPSVTTTGPDKGRRIGSAQDPGGLRWRPAGPNRTWSTARAPGWAYNFPGPGRRCGMGLLALRQGKNFQTLDGGRRPPKARNRTAATQKKRKRAHTRTRTHTRGHQKTARLQHTRTHARTHAERTQARKRTRARTRQTRQDEHPRTPKRTATSDAKATRAARHISTAGSRQQTKRTK